MLQTCISVYFYSDLLSYMPFLSFFFPHVHSFFHILMLLFVYLGILRIVSLFCDKSVCH
jgi:hypothetical protein